MRERKTDRDLRGKGRREKERDRKKEGRTDKQSKRTGKQKDKRKRNTKNLDLMTKPRYADKIHIHLIKGIYITHVEISLPPRHRNVPV